MPAGCADTLGDVSECSSALVILVYLSYAFCPLDAGVRSCRDRTLYGPLVHDLVRTRPACVAGAASYRQAASTCSAGRRCPAQRPVDSCPCSVCGGVTNHAENAIISRLPHVSVSTDIGNGTHRFVAVASLDWRGPTRLALICACPRSALRFVMSVELLPRHVVHQGRSL
jgi:hypothetical protein